MSKVFPLIKLTPAILCTIKNQSGVYKNQDVVYNIEASVSHTLRNLKVIPTELIVKQRQ